jgi:hypothetical protein
MTPPQAASHFGGNLINKSMNIFRKVCFRSKQKQQTVFLQVQKSHLTSCSITQLPYQSGSTRFFPASKETASKMAPSRIVALAKEIEVSTSKLDEFFTKNNLPPPSFEEDAPLIYQFPPEIAAAQEALSAALDELTWLNKGPISTIVANSVCIP